MGVPLVSGIDIYGERNIEWSFLTVEMPDGPGEALEFGCEQGYLSLLAAQKGFHVIANDLQEQRLTWQHSSVDFQQGDLLPLKLPSNYFDLIINCSSVEHVGVAGRYGIEKESCDGDLMVMGRLADVLKPGGHFLMTVPCGRDAVMAPWCRVYGRERLPRLLAGLRVVKERYWVKNVSNRWVGCDRESALNFEPQFDAKDAHRCAYALGGFVLAKR
jgi:SAM-dependent methyltransferase